MSKAGNRIFVIDGVDLRVQVTDLERGFSVTDSEHSGRVKSEEMHRDIKGTYYSYTIKVEPDENYRDDYDAFYEIVSAPVAFHHMEFPYNQETLKFQAYVTNGKDNLKVRKIGEKRRNIWSGLSLTFTAREPQRRP